jgi:alpha-galactosidase
VSSLYVSQFGQTANTERRFNGHRFDINDKRYLLIMDFNGVLLHESLVCEALLMRVVIVGLCFVLSIALPATSQQPLASTPPMGWNSWNHFGGRATDADVRAAADMLVSTGMRDAGYIYVNIDDTWQGMRDEHGLIHSNERFPDMKALGDYIHSKGLKFGIYSSPGAKTCAKYEGSLGHETQDAQTYASWGVDFLKYDLCSYSAEMRKAAEQHPDEHGIEKEVMIEGFRKMGDALKATGRPILYSLCQYGMYDVWEWGPEVGAQMWRTTDDISDNYPRMLLIAFAQGDLTQYAGPGHWNDPDMLEIGNGKMSTDEYKTHISLWVLLAAPLLAGNDLSKMSETDRSILINREAIAIDQDPLGKQGELLYRKADISVWTKKLAEGRVAIGLVDASSGSREVSVDLSKIGFPQGANLRDVWNRKDLGHTFDSFTTKVKGHGVTLLIASR